MIFKGLRSGLLACALFLLAGSASAQETGRIIGRVLDAGTARPLSGAQVFVNDGVVGTLSDLNGRYVLGRVPAGTVDVTVQQLGYGTKTVTGVQVAPGETTALDISLEETALELEGITVSAEREQGSNAFLLDQRRTSSALVEAVGAAEISRRPDSDAADVAQRMTGVTVSEGKYVYVRGLGQRYSQTTLNGSSLPSPEPEKETVPLDLFPSGFLESLVTQKTYTPDLPADFSGGSVKIQTKDFPNDFTFSLGVGTSYNTMSTFQDGYLYYPGGGTDFIGLDDGSRDQPATVRDIMGDVMSGQRLPTDPNQRIQIGQAFQGLNQPFAPLARSAPLNRSFNLSVGGRTDVFDDGELGFLFAGTYSDDYVIRDNDVERKWRSTAFQEGTADIETPTVEYAYNTGTRAVSWGTIANVAFKPNPGQKIALKTTVNLSTDGEAREYQGLNDEDIGAFIRSERSRWVERLMLWGQLSGEHETFFDSKLDWRLTAARADRDEPLLRETIYDEDPVNPGEFFLLDFTESARYFYSALTDDDLSAEFDWRVPFEFFGSAAAVKFGAAYRDRTRDFGARRLNWLFPGAQIQDLDSALESATIVDGNNPGAGEFSISEVVEPGDLYDARDERVAGYLMVELPVTEKLQAVFGARVEDYSLELNSRGSRLSENKLTNVTPSLNLTYSFTDAVKLRGSVSQTVDRPEFRELAPFQFTEATSLRQLFGNPELESAIIRSGDLRLDWFPRPGEVLSIGGFYKDMDEPIEQVFVAAASSAFSFQNANAAQVIGLELDVQLGLDRLAESLRDFSFQGNYSWIDSEVDVRAEGIFFPTNLNRALEGQAPYVLNTGLNYANPRGFQAGVFFNRFGPRISAAGGSGVPDIEEQPRNMLDASLGFPLPGGVRAKIKANNLLDADYLFTQSANGFTQVQRLYTVGRTFSVGLSWEF